MERKRGEREKEIGRKRERKKEKDRKKEEKDFF